MSVLLFMKLRFMRCGRPPDHSPFSVWSSCIRRVIRIRKRMRYWHMNVRTYPNGTRLTWSWARWCVWLAGLILLYGYWSVRLGIIWSIWRITRWSSLVTIVRAINTIYWDWLIISPLLLCIIVSMCCIWRTGLWWWTRSGARVSYVRNIWYLFHW